MIPRVVHIYLKTLLNRLLESMTIIETVPNDRTTFSMKSFARCYACVSIVIVKTTNYVKSHVGFSRRRPSELFERDVPGSQRLVWMIYNGIVTGQKKKVLVFDSFIHYIIGSERSLWPMRWLRSEACPENPKSHAVQCFIFFHMVTGRPSMEVAEKCMSQWLWKN